MTASRSISGRKFVTYEMFIYHHIINFIQYDHHWHSTRPMKAEQALETSAMVNLAMFLFTEDFRVLRMLWDFELTFLLSSDHN